jgi:hypothetical protein
MSYKVTKPFQRNLYNVNKEVCNRTEGLEHRRGIARALCRYSIVTTKCLMMRVIRWIRVDGWVKRSNSLAGNMARYVADGHVAISSSIYNGRTRAVKLLPYEVVVCSKPNICTHNLMLYIFCYPNPKELRQRYLKWWTMLSMIDRDLSWERSASASCSGGLGFKFRPGDWLSWGRWSFQKRKIKNVFTNKSL